MMHKSAVLHVRTGGRISIFVCLVLYFACTANAQPSNAGHTLPITSNRTISFITDEASYIDIDPSPDGKTLLVSFLGELYTLPITGGNAKQLTQGLAINRYPKWSPDGRFIAYKSDGTGSTKVHIVDTLLTLYRVLGEGNTQVENSDPIWLPDSKQICFGDQIYLLIGTQLPLVKGVKRLLDFSADAKYFYYQEDLSLRSSAISRCNRTSGENEKILVFDRPVYKFKNPRISLDAKWLSYIKEGSSGLVDSLMIINLQTGQERLLAKMDLQDDQQIIRKQYSFSKDSKYLFIGYGGKIHRIRIDDGFNEIVPFKASVKIEVAELNYNRFSVSCDSFDVKYIRNSQCSPDGKQLLFTALNRIYTMELPNGIPKVLVGQPVNQFQPKYSPNGRSVVYVSWDDLGGGQVWVVGAQGGKPKQITKIAGLYMHPSWSPDGSRIIVTKGNNKLGRRDNPGVGQLVIISLDGKKTEVVSETVPLFNQPEFSLDGENVIYKPSQSGGDNKIWPRLVSQNIRSATVKVLAVARKDEESLDPIRQIVISPNGRYLVFTYNDDLFLTPVADPNSPQMIFDASQSQLLIRFARGAFDPNWEQGGKYLSWTSANCYYRINPDKIIDEVIRLLPRNPSKEFSARNIIDVNIAADQEVLIHLKEACQTNRGILALTNARIVTMQDNRIIENGIVIIEGGRVIGIGEIGKIAIPKPAKIFDLKGKTIIPGLIDMHSHMYEAVPCDVFLQQSWQRLLNLSYGVTTIRDPSGSFDTFGYGELIETGQMIGPRLFTVGRAVRERYNLVDLAEAQIVVDNRKKMGATTIKQYQQPTRFKKQLLQLACKNEKMNMTNEGDLDPFYLLAMVKDGVTGVEHNPSWGDVHGDILSLLSKTGTYFTPTLQANTFRNARNYFRKFYGQGFVDKSSKYFSEDYKRLLTTAISDVKLDTDFLRQARVDAALIMAGMKVMAGSHGEDQGIGTHWEMWALQMGGLTNYEALETATITAAEGLGMQKDLGSIEVGKIADLIILDKNPLEDIHNTNTIKYVMKAGVLYDSATLDQIWPNKVKGPTVWR